MSKCERTEPNKLITTDFCFLFLYGGNNDCSCVVERGYALMLSNI